MTGVVKSNLSSFKNHPWKIFHSLVGFSLGSATGVSFSTYTSVGVVQLSASNVTLTGIEKLIPFSFSLKVLCDTIPLMVNVARFLISYPVLAAILFHLIVTFLLLLESDVSFVPEGLVAA